MKPATIRCPDCGRRAPATETTCPGCRSSLLQLCECGATSHMAAQACAACGAELQAPTYVRRPVALRITVAVVLVALAGTAGWAFWNARQRHERKAEIWRLSDDAFAAVKAGRFREALPILKRYTAERPRDAQMLYLLAVTERQLDASALAGVEAAQAALNVDGSFSEAAAFLAAAFDAAGDVEQALDYVRRAVAGSRPRSEDFRLLASLELRRRRPDVDAAIVALRRAQELDAGAGKDPRVTVMLALLELRRLGDPRMSALPGDVLGTVAAAEEIVLSAEGDLADDPLIRLAELELAIAHERAAPARRLAERLVADDDVPPDVALRARVLLGKAALMDGDVIAARRAFDDALQRAPTRGTAVDVAAACHAAGEVDLAAELLTSTLGRADADPGIRDVLASLQVAQGMLDGALAGLEAARAERPDDPALLIQLGDVHAARGEHDAADAAYGAAEAHAEPGDAMATLRRALLRVSRSVGIRARRAAAAAAVARLDARLGDADAWTDASALEIRGRLAVLAGQADDAQRVLRRALGLASQSAPVRISLAEALLAGAGPDSMERASALLREAADLAPYDERSVDRAARLFIAMGNPQQAAAVCRRFLDRMGDRPAVLDTLSIAQRRQGRWSDAAASLERLRAASDDDSGAVLRRLVDSLLRSGEAGEARRFVAELDPDGRDPRLPLLLALHGATPDARIAALRAEGPGLELALALLARGDAAAARDALRDAVATAPSDFAARRALVLLLLDAEGEPSVDALDEAGRLASATPVDAAPGERETLEGAVALGTGRADAARALLEIAAESLPDDPYAHLLLGRALFESGAREEALGPLRRAVSLPGALPGFSPVLARCLHAVAQDAGTPGLRERLLWEALLHDAVNVEVTVDLVNLLFESGRDGDSGRLARRLIAFDAQSPELLSDELTRGLRRLVVAATLRATGLRALLASVDEFPFEDAASADLLMDGLLLLRAGRDAEAARLLDAVLERHPGTPIASIAAIEALVREGRLEAARGVVERAEAAGAGAASRFRTALAAALLRAHRPSDALAETAAAVRADPTDEELVEARVHAALSLDERSSALATIATAQSSVTGPAAVRLGLLRSAVLREHGSPAEALDLARELRATADGDPVLVARIRLAEAEALLRLGRYDELEVLAPDLALDPADTGRDALRAAARVAFVHGTLAMVRGRAEEAARRLRESLALDPSEPAAANNLAWLYAARPSRALEALELARSATAAAEGNPEYWDTRAACARTLGRADEAEESWRKALVLLGPEPETPEALRVELWIGLAELLAEESRFEEAVALARRVLEAGPAPEMRQRARAVLRLR